MKLIFDSLTKLRLRALYLGLVAPLAVLILALKSLRIVGPSEFEHLAEIFSLYRSDILLLILFSIAGSMAVTCLKNRQRDIAIGVLQVSAILWACIEIIAHQFYAVTGSTIDFGIFLVHAIHFYPPFCTSVSIIYACNFFFFFPRIVTFLYTLILIFLVETKYWA